jgi:cyclic-di-GMP-binding protein
VKLPELNPRATPQFVDAESCKSWLENLALANVALAQQDLLAELEVFNGFPTSTANRLAVLEALRETVSFVQIEQAKRFTNRALPMAEAEAAAFEDTVELWEQMRIGYLRCLHAALGGDTGMRAQASLLAQRLAAYSGLRMFHYYRAYREVPGRDWRSLHEVYAHAEKLGVAEDDVKDVLNRDIQDSSPRIAYVRALLMGIASPHELGQRNLTFVAFLLERWASKVEVAKKPMLDPDGVPPLVIDLAGERAPERVEAATPLPAEPRYLDTRRLAKSLRNRVALLRKGESPAKLALGEDCVQPSCEQMLVFLFRQWCQAKPPRPLAGRSGTLNVQVTNDMEAIHHYMSSGHRRRRIEAQELTQQQRQELETLGRIRSVHNEEYTSARGYALEEWKIEEDSATELHMLRPAAGGTKRYAHGQLVAVRPPDASGFILGQVRWLIGAVNGELRAGVKLMPGIATPTSVRGTGLNDTAERPTSALSLAAVAAVKSPPTLVLPAGWYKPKRVLEVVAEKPYNVRLTEVIERGADFERVAYEAA